MSKYHDVIKSALPIEEKLSRLKALVAQNEPMDTPDKNGLSPRGLNAALGLVGLLKAEDAKASEFLYNSGAGFNQRDTQLYRLLKSKRFTPVELIYLISAELVDLFPTRPAQKLHGIQWYEGIKIPKGLLSFIPENDFTAVTSTCKTGLEGIKLISMGKFGQGIACTELLKKGTRWLYGGILDLRIEKNKNEYAMEILIKGRGGYGTVEASKYGNAARFFQHLPQKSDIEKLNFFIPAMKTTIATENLIVSHESYPEMKNNIFAMALTPIITLSEDVNLNEIIGFDYGTHYWEAIFSNPMLFDKFGNWVHPVFYENDLITIALDKKSGDIITGYRDKFIKYVKENKPFIYENFILQPDELRSILEEQGFIPKKPAFRYPNDPERELRQAASDGRLEDVIYLIDWHEPIINIHAKGKEYQKSALDFATKKGHIYIALFLQLRSVNKELTCRADNTPSIKS